MEQELHALHQRQSSFAQHYSDLATASSVAVITSEEKNDKISSFVDPLYRHSICQWGYNVIDFWKMDRVIVTYFMDFLDRFLLHYKCDSTVLRLASLAALYLSIKVHHYDSKHNFNVGDIMSLSRGEFDEGHVYAMERMLCKGLEWKLHPPTACEFVTCLLTTVFGPRKNLDEEQESIYLSLKAHALFGCELAVCDVTLSRIKPSTLAAACLRYAIKVCGISDKWAKEIYELIERTSGQPCDKSVTDLDIRVTELFEKNSSKIEASENSKPERQQHRRIVSKEELVGHVRSTEIKSASSKTMPTIVATVSFGLECGEDSSDDEMISPVCVSTSSKLKEKSP